MLVSVVTMTTELGDITSVFAGVFAAKMPEDCLQVTFLFSDTRCGAGLMRQWVKCQAPPRVPRKPRAVAAMSSNDFLSLLTFTELQYFLF